MTGASGRRETRAGAGRACCACIARPTRPRTSFSTTLSAHRASPAWASSRHQMPSSTWRRSASTPACGSVGNRCSPISGAHASSASARCRCTASGTSASTTSQAGTAWSWRAARMGPDGHRSPGGIESDTEGSSLRERPPSSAAASRDVHDLEPVDGVDQRGGASTLAGTPFQPPGGGRHPCRRAEHPCRMEQTAPRAPAACSLNLRRMGQSER